MPDLRKAIAEQQEGTSTNIALHGGSGPFSP
jgi:hypothetical protein